MAKKKSSTFGGRIKATLNTIDSPTFNVGFTHIDKWLDMGNYALNRIMGGQFDKGLLFGRNYVYYGESGSGKSLQCAYSCADAQQAHGAHIVWIDVEKASDDRIGMEFFRRAGIDIDEENFTYTSAASLEEIKSTISSISMMYRKAIKEGETDLTPVVFVVDSWSAALTSSQWEQAEKGTMKGDQGQKAKQTGDVILSATHLSGGLPIMVIGIAHVMENQEMYGRKHKITGGMKMVFYASGCLLLTKKQLIADDLDDKDLSEKYKEQKKGMTKEMQKKTLKRQVGFTCVAENLKSRVAKPFEKVEIQIPYEKGMDRYSGLFELLIQEGVITNPTVGWYGYVLDGKEVKFRKGDFQDHAEAIMAVADQDIAGSEEVIVDEESK